MKNILNSNEIDESGRGKLSDEARRECYKDMTEILDKMRVIRDRHIEEEVIGVNAWNRIIKNFTSTRERWMKVAPATPEEELAMLNARKAELEALLTA